MSLFIKFILHEKPDTHVHKGMHCLENAVVNSKTPENMARLTAEERERERELLVWCSWVQVMPMWQES